MDVGISGGISAEDTAETGDHPFQITKIPEADKAAGRFSEVEHQEFSTGLGNAVHLGKAPLKFGKVAQAIGDGDTVVVGFRLAGVQGVAGLVFNVSVASALFGDFQHRLAKIHRGDFCALPSKGKGDVTGSAAKIKGALAGFYPG